MRTKKILPLLLALLLVFSSSASVFAIDYYEEWGPMWDWTDEQWEVTDSWTEEEWDAYYDAEYAAWEMEEKIAMGFTNLDGINVFFDGVCLDFKDVTPVIRDGCTMVPFRTIFETFGATVDYKTEDGKKIIVATLDDTTLNLTVGDLSMEVVKEDSTETVTLSASPYIAGNHSYVPLRAVSEGLGYDVIWNEWDQVVEIIDSETLIAEINEGFSLYNRLLSESVYDPEVTYKTTGSTSLLASLYGDGGNSTGGVKGNFTALQQGMSVDMKANIQLDLDAFSESLNYIMGEDMVKNLASVKDTPFDLIMDGNSFNTFVKSPLVIFYMKEMFSAYSYYDEEIPEFSLKENDWLELPFEEIIYMPDGALGYYFEQFEDPTKLTLGQVLYMTVVPSDGETWGVNLYKEMQSTVDLLDVFFGDANFVKKGNSYVLELDRMDLMKQLTPIVAEEMGEVNVTDALGFLHDIPEANYKVVLTEKNGRLSDITISGLIKLNGAVPVTISFDLTGDDQVSKCNFSVAGRYFGKLEVQMDSLTVETTESLRTAPPAGENVRNLEDFYDELYSTDSSDWEEEPASEEENGQSDNITIPKEPLYQISDMLSGIWENGGSPIVPNRLKGIIHEIQLNHLPHQR